MKAFLLILGLVLVNLNVALGGLDPDYICAGCIIISGLIEQSAQYHVGDLLGEKCTTVFDKTVEVKACQIAAKAFSRDLVGLVKPETLCDKVGVCPRGCQLFNEWPMKHLPDAQTPWPVERRLTEEESQADYTLLQPVFASLFGPAHPRDSELHWLGHVSLALGDLTGMTTGGECGQKNVSCKINMFADEHVPLFDVDGDKFAPAESKRFRGTHWRGVDCNDKIPNVYPGRKNTVLDASVDHNCNGISGKNELGETFESLYCAGTEQRGIIHLGDSATAHFHIPPQWLTAKGWNMHGLLPDAMDEMDFPHCAWGTGHATPEECPYQYPVPGVSGVVSLYSKLRERNRCNHNDFQNVGVNGARVTSSMQLVDSFARSPNTDHPAIVWYSLIGNDVCNGHAGFEHMTKPEEFYNKAMEAMSVIDTKVPKGSYVIALSLFEGELLYDIMHDRQHPAGSKYIDLYDFMNCMEFNPCWGWLNSNVTDRRLTTSRAHSLNDQYDRIEKEQNFKNFKFIHYQPEWIKIFSKYLAKGVPLHELIEKTDGFHPSQAGNAIFAEEFFAWLEKNHPDVLGPINPHNEEIDKLFFSQ